MPKFNYLPHNTSDFPKLENVDTYKYDNEFDYGRFDYTQMSLLVCTVPWDMGEAHIGNRTISGIGNVVYFESKQARDKWFEDIPDSECYRFTTKFKELHRDGFIDVPIPYDMCAKHNYLVVHYEKFANENSPVMFEGDDGLRDWFWWESRCLLPAANCVLFTTEEGTVIPTVTVAPTGMSFTPNSGTVHAGGTIATRLNLTGTVEGDTTGLIGVEPDAATYSVVGSRAVDDSVVPVELNSRTYVDAYGKLHVQKTGLLVGDVLTVTATSAYINPSGETSTFTATFTATIVNG